MINNVFQVKYRYRNLQTWNEAARNMESMIGTKVDRDEGRINSEAVGEEISGWVAECTRPKSLDEEGPKHFAC
jgi:hypothetical protein